ncbi:DNA cytosine methyltransferase [Halobaculum sp. MBLA0147]|uniref:DNA cytosine methyltransferase n=1 Tax=Halobaculum sp. MBLA0147 TaxID=3079934 RepID=UPI0035263655
MTDDHSDRVVAVDLFAGAGGFSEALTQVCSDLGYDLQLAAINHDETAIATHEQAHPEAVQYHSKAQQLHPPNVIDDLVEEPVDDVHQADVSVDLLIAGPECTHFSRARGGKPVREQKRMPAWHVLEWVGALAPDTILIENTPEIQTWGPVVDGEPTRNGDLFEIWTDAFASYGYALDVAELNAADYGAPQRRSRFFLHARRDGRPTFPSPTHGPDSSDDTSYRTAADIIDWSDLGTSIWTRDLTESRVHSPPADSTMDRIAQGLREFGPPALTPFADALAGLDRDRIKTLREDIVPLSENPAAVHRRDEPFLVDTASVNSEDSDSTSLSLMLPASVTDAATSREHDSPSTSDGDRLPTYLCPLYNSTGDQPPRTRSIDRPLMTVTASKPAPSMLASPVLTPFIDDAQAAPSGIREPLHTQTTTETHSLVVPSLHRYGLDIKYRMLQPAELKQAQGFPSEYPIQGTKSEQTTQIGNAVPVPLAKALLRHALTESAPNLRSYGGGIPDHDPDEVAVPAYDEVLAEVSD